MLRIVRGLAGLAALALVASGCALATITPADPGRGTLSLQVQDLKKFASASSLSLSQKARGLLVEDLVAIEVSIAGFNISDPLVVTAELGEGRAALSIPNIPLGPNRVITVQALDVNGYPIPGARILGTVDIYPGYNETTVNWDTTPRGRVFADLLWGKGASDYARTVSAAEVENLVQALRSSVAHPLLIDADAIAAAIRDQGGVVPEPSEDFLIPPATVHFSVAGLGEGFPATFRLSDPVSAPVTLNSDGEVVFENVIPGSWGLAMDIGDGWWTARYLPGEDGLWVSAGTNLDLGTLDFSGELWLEAGFVFGSRVTVQVPEAFLGQITRLDVEVVNGEARHTYTIDQIVRQVVVPVDGEYELVTVRGYDANGGLRFTGKGSPTNGLVTVTLDYVGVGAADRIVVLQDGLPWGSNALISTLETHGFAAGEGAGTYQVVNSEAFDSLVLDPSNTLLIIANDQSQTFYNRLATISGQINYFVSTGGTLFFEACDNGWAEGSISAAGITLPGGVTVVAAFDDINTVAVPDHPLFTNIETTLTGSYASHAAFDNLPEDALVLTTNTANSPTLVTYAYGAGLVFLTGQTLEAALNQGWNTGNLLPALIDTILGVLEPPVRE